MTIILWKMICVIHVMWTRTCQVCPHLCGCNYVTSWRNNHFRMAKKRAKCTGVQWRKKLESALLHTRCVFLKFLFWISVVRGDEKHTKKSSFRSASFVKAPLYFCHMIFARIIYGDFQDILPYGSDFIPDVTSIYKVFCSLFN